MQQPQNASSSRQHQRVEQSNINAKGMKKLISHGTGNLVPSNLGSSNLSANSQPKQSKVQNKSQVLNLKQTLQMKGNLAGMSEAVSMNQDSNLNS